jgi:hypothetical protein
MSQESAKKKLFTSAYRKEGKSYRFFQESLGQISLGQENPEAFSFRSFFKKKRLR